MNERETTLMGNCTGEMINIADMLVINDETRSWSALSDQERTKYRATWHTLTSAGQAMYERQASYINELAEAHGQTQAAIQHQITEKPVPTFETMTYMLLYQSEQPTLVIDRVVCDGAEALLDAISKHVRIPSSPDQRENYSIFSLSYEVKDDQLHGYHGAGIYSRCYEKTLIEETGDAIGLYAYLKSIARHYI